MLGMFILMYGGNFAMLVTLHSENYEVTINSLGAELKSFLTPDKKEFVWNSDPAFWMRSSPLLFPTIGNVRNNTTLFHGHPYPMPKHGFCKDSEFTVTKQTADQAAFTLKSSADTLAFYPFSFELCLSYHLIGHTLEMTYSVTNTDSKDLPYHIGAHPGFMCPLNEGEALTDYQLVFEKEEDFRAVPYNLEQLCFSAGKQVSLCGHGTILPLTQKLFDNDAVFFPHINSRLVQLVHRNSNYGVEVAYPDFCSIAFWTPIGGKAPFLCIEPWNGSAIFDDEDDEFITKRNVQFLSPGESKDYHLRISLLEH